MKMMMMMMMMMVLMVDSGRSESKISKQGFTLTVRVTVCLVEIKIAAAVTNLFLLLHRLAINKGKTHTSMAS